jgi:hypothetical protein
MLLSNRSGRFVMHDARCRRMFLVALALWVNGCATGAPSTSRYVVTATPIDVFGTGNTKLCIAVDPSDAHGVWWWEPGPSGCSTRTTGPTVFQGDGATVVASHEAGAVAVEFRMQLTIGGFRDVRLRLQDDAIQLADSGVRVSTERRPNLDIPFAYGR